MSERTIDELDRVILNILQENGRISNAEIARQVGKAPSAVLERVRKLERKGFITGYEAVVDQNKVGRKLTAFTMVFTDEPAGSFETGRELAKIPEVLEVHYTAGQAPYLVKVRVESTEDLQRILARFGAIPTVRDTNSTIVLTTVKESRGIPVAPETVTNGDEPH
ncbi:Lrp/AsnC family transcriptional regulator [Desulfovibrio oxyclinae]|jgi:Lrp/AsnC family leucine-responsive transcriptional regulator|uniref:Lrp/AsnC family transcriptional regulator n=1 Tax=Desulfovibrio oxyclinae TaxID=63560 RepID=UPI00036D8BA8|nr:Lrp/AsnC family transcriptional regulator [Desulfovibrio oxyclinae]